VRVFLSILLFIFVVALVTFIIQNTHNVEIRFLGWKQDAPMAVVSLGLYFLGMLSGWAVLSFLRRSIRAIREQPRG
jgi:uncharacterized integral membrane protein